MIKAEQIPDEAYKAWQNALFSDKGGKAAIAAAINAWPGMREARNGSSASLNPHIILPLTQESGNE